MMSGAWLEANTPTSLAMARPRRRGRSGGPHFSQEIRLGHSGDHEIETQKIRVDPRREEGHVVALDRGTHLGLQGIAIEDLLPVGAVLVAEHGGALKIEEELAQPVVSHGAILPRARCYCFVPRSRVRGTNLTGRVRLVVVRPSDCFSTSRRCCTSEGPPTGITIRPPGLSWSISGCGTDAGAAGTKRWRGTFSMAAITASLNFGRPVSAPVSRAIAAISATIRARAAAR